MAAVELEDDVGWCFVGLRPAFFLYGYVLAFAVEGIEDIVAIHQPHVLVVETFFCDVSVVYGKGLPLFPVGVVAEIMLQRSYSEGMDIAVGVFPTLLQ